MLFEVEINTNRRFQKGKIVRMKTVSFYSFKGGVGRSLALAYMAKYLAERGLKVCILDVDLEAPGVIYKFFDRPTHDKLGVLDYIRICMESKAPDSIKDYFYEVSGLNSESGNIKVMSAGQKLDGAYWKILSQIDWRNLFKGDNNIGLGIFENLKKQIESQISPDYLFIDSRSGVTVLSKVCSAVLSDVTIMLMANNSENFHGAKLMYKYIASSRFKSKSKKTDVFCVLTRIPVPTEDSPQESDLIGKLVTEISDPHLQNTDVTVIHSDSRAEFDEYTVLQNVMSDKQNSVIQDDYFRLIVKIDPEMIDKMLDKKLDESQPNVSSKQRFPGTTKNMRIDPRVLVINNFLHAGDTIADFSATASLDMDGKSHFAVKVLELSAGGLLFQSGIQYKIGDSLRFKLRIDPLHHGGIGVGFYNTIIMDIKAVIKTHREDAEKYTYGVKFTGISNSDKIRLDEFVRFTIFKYMLDDDKFLR